MAYDTHGKPMRWTEAELKNDIAQIERALVGQDKQSCASAYLREVLKDRKSALKVLRLRQRTEVARQEPPRAEMSWPAPMPRREFRPLLQV